MKAIKNHTIIKMLRKIYLITSIVLILAVSIYGCRKSPVLQQVIYTQDSDEVDQTNNQLRPDDTGEQDSDFKNQITDDTDVKRDMDHSLAINSKDSNQMKPSANVNYSPTGTALATAANGPDNNPDPNGTQDTRTGTDNNSDAPDTPDGSEEGDGQAIENPQYRYGGPKETVTVGDGALKEIPTKASKVAAVGVAAQVVEMTAGTDHILFTNQEFAGSGNEMAQAVFAEDIGNMTQLWSKDGTQPLNAQGFQTLLDSDVDVCFYTSGQSSLTPNQIAQLEEAGITCVPLFAANSAEKLKNNVTIVATVFKVTTDGNSIQIAQEYGKWVDQVTHEVSKSAPVSMLHSIYISGWSQSSYQFTKGDSTALPSNLPEYQGSGTGVATAWSYNKPQLISVFMNAAHVKNESTMADPSIRTQSVYVTPMFHQFAPRFSETTYNTYYDQVGAGYDAFVTYTEETQTTGLGADLFPAVIVADRSFNGKSLKSLVQNNWFWQYHGGANGVLGGYTNPDTGKTLHGSIVGPYNIYVNPAGIGDWAEESVESPLEGYWVSYMFSNTFSLNEVKSKVSDFYSRFLHYTLSEEELNQILQLNSNS